MTSRGTFEGTLHRYIGRSTETKPGTLRGDAKPPSGSSFFETDTWRIARYDGNQWRYEPDNPALVELQAIRQLLETVLERLPEREFVPFR